MPRVQICRECKHTIDVEEEGFVLLADGETMMHDGCYEDELKEKDEQKTKGAKA